MIRFANRTELVLWVDSHAPSRTIQRALWDGEVELLGGFDELPPSKYPGWVFRIVSKYHKEYFVAVVCNMKKKSFFCIQLESVPWKLWNGKLGRKSIYEGDKPEKYKELKNE